MTTLRRPNLLLAAALLLGALADLLFYGHAVGISAPIFIGLGLAALFGLSRAEARPPAPANLWIGAAALSFAGWLAVRAEPALAFFNGLAVLALLPLLLVGQGGEPLHRLPPLRLLVHLAVALIESVWRPAALALSQIRRAPIGGPQLRAVAPVARGAMLAIPVLAVFTGLLMLGDGIFASYVLDLFSLKLPFSPQAALAHSIFVGCFTWACAGGLLVALSGETTNRAWADPLPAEGDTQRLSRADLGIAFLGATEGLTVLLLVDLLFAGFMAIQGAYFFGGLDTLARTGMSYADYARHGFFELLAVACLALSLLWVLALITRRSGGQIRLFNAACAAMVLLVLGILASAFQRMWLYELAYGFTSLRLYTHSFMIWLALVLLLFLAALFAARPQIFSAGGFASALIYLTVLNIASPDALIVRENIARYQKNPAALTASTEIPLGEDTYGYREDATIDITYLLSLSSDAVPELVAALPLLAEPQRSEVRSELEQTRAALERAAAADGWQGWQISRARALAALSTLAP
jgi:hypothetical protein